MRFSYGDMHPLYCRAEHYRTEQNLAGNAVSTQLLKLFNPWFFVGIAFPRQIKIQGCGFASDFSN